MVALDDARVSLADGHAGNVDLLAGREHVHLELGARLELLGILRVHAELAQLGAGFDAGLGEMARHGLGDPGGAALAERDLDGHVAVGFLGLHLRDAVAAAVEHRHGDGGAVVLEDAHHADLAADETETHL